MLNKNINAFTLQMTLLMRAAYIWKFMLERCDLTAFLNQYWLGIPAEDNLSYEDALWAWNHPNNWL